MKTDHRVVSVRRLTALLASTAIALQPFAAVAGDVLPTGGQVVSGSVSVGTSGSAMTVTQGSDKAIVNWNSFSIGAGNSVTFVQPDSSSAILNRVTGDTTSTLAGSLTANGQVYLINPNGIAITSTGSVQVGGGFVASTLDIADDDFLQGALNFSGNGASASVSNEGVITVGRGGYAALIGGTVKNDGLIAVPMGKVGLGSGEQATLDLSGDGFLQVALPTQDGAEGDGALIENSGTIAADGGTVVMRAATARDAARKAVNISGSVEANSISGEDGEIVIGGGEGGAVEVSGTLSTTSASAKGGKITVTGQSIALKGASVDASGATGGGSVKIGGDYQGTGTTQRAETVSVDADSTIHADATDSGNGGSVVVWSDNHTTFAGLITAQGAGTGTGGDAEVSGKALLSYTGFANLSGPGGFGTLLLDPYNITISDDADSNVSGFDASGDDSVLSVSTLTTALSGANVTVTTGSSGSQDGNITVNSAISWSADTILTLSAANNIAINANIIATGTNAGLVLNYGNYASAGTATSGTDYSVASGASITLSGASASLAINGTNYTLIHSQADLEAVNDGLSGAYALAGDLDLSGTTYTTAVIGQGSSGIFTGRFAGLGHTISNLTISATGNYVGLFGYSTGTIRGIGLLGGSVSGGSFVGSLAGISAGTISNAYATGSVNGSGGYVGGLAGENDGTISNAYATGDVSGSAYTGGLVGLSFGAISNSYATGAVRGSSSYVGGLVGRNSRTTITNSYATGTVSGSSSVGGLVGYNNAGTIINSYATGTVSGSSSVGGLAGYNTGTISYTYASGSVAGSTSIGGLVGGNSGTITASFYDSETTGQSAGVGSGSSSGITALTTAQARSASSYTGWDFDTVWYQTGDMRPILRSEAATAVNGVITVSNLHQLALIGANLSASYVLITDLDASETDATAVSYDASGIWGPSGFVPIGTSSAAFTGTFSGAGHTISNLTIHSSGEYVGLFGYSSGTISDIGLVGGSVGGTGKVGMLAGYSSGAISNVYVTGAVYVSVSGSGWDFGGLVGRNDGGIISNAYATVAVSGYNGAGGLVGRNINGTISNVYATGAVSGAERIGGLVGFNNGGAISAAYATGAVSGTNHVGGLVGYHSGTISNSYATGAVSFAGFNFFGGLVGTNSGTITASFFNSETTGLSAGAGSGSITGITALTTAQMSDLSIFAAAGWDIDDQGGTGTVWRIYDGYSTPLLRSFLTSITISGGSSSKTYDGLTTSSSVGSLSYSLASYDASQILGTAVYTTSSADVGNYTGLTLSGLYSGQTGYDISYATGTGTVTITPATLVVTANDASTTYDGSAYTGGNGVTYTGFVNGETASVLGGTLSYGGTSQGATDAGTYTLTASGQTSNNYDITYVDGTLTVNQRAITVTADAKTMTYGDAVPTLTYQVTSGLLVDGDTLSGALSTTATSSSGVGSYDILQGTLDNANYAISYNSGTLTIAKAALTVTANNASKTYDGVSYSGGNGVTYSGFVNGESSAVLGGALAYGGTAQGATNAGSYVLTASGLTSDNYDITYVDGTLTVSAVLTSAESGSQLVSAALGAFGSTPGLTRQPQTVGASAGSGGASGAGGDIAVKDPRLSGAVCALGPNLSVACN